MTTWARNVGSVAVDVTKTNPTTIFHPDVAAEFIVVPDGTQAGATWDGTKWNAPVAPPPPPVRYPVLTPMQFYLAFTPAERIAIKNSTDPVVKEFWATYELAVQMSNPVDMNLVSIQEGLNYLSATNQSPANSPLTTYVATSRVAQIQQGIPQ